MGRVETLADIQRQFNALFATKVAYKPFHNQLAKRTFPDFMREVLSRILQQWVVEVLQPKARAPLGEFGHILIQDGCSFAVKETLREQYPGRFNKQNLAAVEPHVTMSLLDESVEAVTLTEDTASERAHRPCYDVNDPTMTPPGQFWPNRITSSSTNSSYGYQDRVSSYPLGCHSRPPFLNFPTSSFFFVSTETTG